MPKFWKRWFGSQKQGRVPLSLVNHAENYLLVFQAGSTEEKNRHSTELFEAANRTGRHVGALDFLSLIELSDIEALGKAAIYSRQRFDRITTAAEGGYWLSAYALTHLMILNKLKSFEDTPDAKKVAQNAAHLYSAEFTRRAMSA